MSKLSKITIGALLAGSLLTTGCGGGSSGGINGSAVVSGTGLAAYIKNGIAFLDIDKNGTNNNEPNITTNNKGSFNIPTTIEVINKNYQIVITNGNNSETNQPIPYPTIAPKGFSMVSPISTIIASVGENNSSIKNILKAFGIFDGDINKIKNLDYNKYNEINTDEINISKLVAIKLLIEATLGEANTNNFTSVKNVASIIAGVIKDNKDINITNLADILEGNLTEKGYVNFSFDSNVIESIQKVSQANANNLEDIVKSAEENLSTIMKKANSYLKIINNKVTIGGKTATVTNGNFETISIEIGEVSDLDSNSSLFDISFDINDDKFEYEKEVNISVALQIKAQDNDNDKDSRVLVAYIDEIIFKKDTGFIVPVNATLKAYGIKRDGKTTLETTKTNESENTYGYNNGTISLNLKDIFDKLNSSTSSIDLTSLATQGTYEVTAVFSGINIKDTNNSITIFNPLSNELLITGKGIKGIVKIKDNEPPTIILDNNSQLKTPPTFSNL